MKKLGKILWFCSLTGVGQAVDEGNKTFDFYYASLPEVRDLKNKGVDVFKCGFWLDCVDAGLRVPDGVKITFTAHNNTILDIFY